MKPLFHGANVRAASSSNRMRKQCSECKTISAATASRCDACGCQFASHKPRAGRWKFRVASIAVGLCVAIGEYVAFH